MLRKTKICEKAKSGQAQFRRAEKNEEGMAYKI
jgi:hypothetical protein